MLQRIASNDKFDQWPYLDLHYMFRPYTSISYFIRNLRFKYSLEASTENN